MTTEQQTDSTKSTKSTESTDTPSPTSLPPVAQSARDLLWGIDSLDALVDQLSPLAPDLPLGTPDEIATTALIQEFPGKYLVQYLTLQSRLFVGTCSALTCAEKIPSSVFLCRSHWKRLPERLQWLMHSEYRAGANLQSRRYLDGARAAIALLGLEDAAVIPTPQLGNLHAPVQYGNLLDERSHEAMVRLRSSSMEPGTATGKHETSLYGSFTDAGKLAVQEAFIRGFKERGTIRFGCELAQVSRAVIERMLREDPKFAEQFNEADADYKDKLREEADRRGRFGVERRKVIVYKGEVVEDWFETEYSDTMLLAQLKARIPEEYKDREDNGGSGVIPLALLNDIVARVEQAEQKRLPSTGTGTVVEALDAEYTELVPIVPIPDDTDAGS